MRTRVRPAGFCKIQRAVVAVVAPALALAIDGVVYAGGVPVWTGSTANITHNPGTPGGVSFNDPTFPIPSGTATIAAPFNPHVDNFTVSGHNVNTNASAGMSHSESATSAMLSFASGTGVSQTDPSHVQGPSILDISFTTEWDVPSQGFGAPISGSFSMPYGAKIGPGGSASISIVVNWDVINGMNESPLKNYTVNKTTYLGGAGGNTILTSFTAPTTLFNPATFTAGEVIVVQGEITFTADNNITPTISEIPTAADFGLASNSVFLQPAGMGNVIGAALVWSGSQSSNWDTGTTPNFNGTGATSVFNTGDNVTFNDSSTNANVIINAVVSPGSIAVNNSLVSYTFSGPGTIAGGALLTKTGTAAVTLATSNSFAGGVSLLAGTLNIDDPAAIGTGTFNIAGGTIDNTSPVAITLANDNPMIWSGDFTFGGSSPLDLGLGPVALVGNTRVVTVNGTGGLTVGGVISGLGGITKVGPGTLTLSGANTYTGPTKVAAGTLNFAPTGTGIVNITLGGGLNISTGAMVTLAPAAPHSNRILLTLGGVSFSGTSGLLDLANNDLQLQSGTLSSVITEISQGFNSGGWNGSGGITSSIAGADTTHLTALGVIVNNINGIPLYGTTAALGLFDGSNPAPTDILVKFTYFGDANLDGKIDGSDYSRIDAGFLARSSTWYNGDFNYDGNVNGSDYTLIDNAFNSQGASLAGSIADPAANITAQLAGSSPVPEPAAIGLLAISATAILKRRQRRDARTRSQ